MNLEVVINVLLIIVSMLLIASVLLQQKGSGLGGVFGGDSAVFRTKRGAEKILFFTSWILGIVFLGLMLVNVFI